MLVSWCGKNFIIAPWWDRDFVYLHELSLPLIHRNSFRLVIAKATLNQNSFEFANHLKNPISNKKGYW